MDDLQCIGGGCGLAHSSILRRPGGVSPRRSPPFALAAASSSYRRVTVSGDSIDSASMIMGLCEWYWGWVHKSESVVGQQPDDSAVAQQDSQLYSPRKACRLGS